MEKDLSLMCKSAEDEKLLRFKVLKTIGNDVDDSRIQVALEKFIFKSALKFERLVNHNFYK